jgi:hypothetical protein
MTDYSIAIKKLNSGLQVFSNRELLHLFRIYARDPICEVFCKEVTGKYVSAGLGRKYRKRLIQAGVEAEWQLFIPDACQSGGALNGVAGEKAIASLALTTGTHWLTATDSEQLAAKFDALGHGAFTYVLLERLAGKAAGADDTITVQELRDYLERELP